MGLIFETIVPLPKFRKKSKITGNYSEIIATLNNVSQWLRYKKTEIKNQYKQLCRDFFIPEPPDEWKPITSVVLEYTILRHNTKRIDTDNVIFASKFLADLLVDMGYLIDDNQVTLIIKPYIVDKSLVETQLSMRMYTE